MALNRMALVSAPVTIVAHLEADSTFNADTAPGKGVLPAGTFMKYDPVTMTLAKAALGTDQLCDILADIVDTGPVGIPEILPAMIYRKGVFLRKEIEEANGITITPGEARSSPEPARVLREGAGPPPRPYFSSRQARESCGVIPAGLSSPASVPVLTSL